MKTKPLLLIIALVIITNFSFGQDTRQSTLAPDDGIMLLNTHDFECMPDAVFSKLPSTYQLGAFADIGYQYTKVAETYDASAPFSNMRFWGAVDGSGEMASNEEFLIEFYDGKPGEAGTNIIYTFNVTTSPVATGFFLFGNEIFQIDVDFGTSINQLTGWISVSRTSSTTSSDWFFWIQNNNSGPGGTSLSYNNVTGGWEEADIINRECFFCFGPASNDPTAVPITNWALYLTALLIGSFLFIRIRKIM